MTMVQKILSPLEDTSEESYMSADLDQNNLTTIADLIILINYVLVPGRRPQTRDCFCLEDKDKDGYLSIATGGSDCDDNNFNSTHLAIDSDCSGIIEGPLGHLTVI